MDSAVLNPSDAPLILGLHSLLCLRRSFRMVRLEDLDTHTLFQVSLVRMKLEVMRISGAFVFRCRLFQDKSRQQCIHSCEVGGTLLDEKTPLALM
jgi:hypothetical protein